MNQYDSRWFFSNDNNLPVYQLLFSLEELLIEEEEVLECT